MTNWYSINYKQLDIRFNYIGRRSHAALSTQRKQPTCRKHLTNLITYICIEYTLPSNDSDLSYISVVVDSDYRNINTMQSASSRRSPIVHNGPQLEIASMMVPNCWSHSWCYPTGDCVHSGPELEIVSMTVSKWIKSYFWTRQISTSLDHHSHYFFWCRVIIKFHFPCSVNLIHSNPNNVLRNCLSHILKQH